MAVRRFPAAPWPSLLKASSALVTVLLLGVAVAAYRAVPAASGFTHYFGLGIAVVPALILILSLLFTVTGYGVSSSSLAIQRLLWITDIPLVGLRRVFAEPEICRGSIRLIGNAGLFSFTGLYRSARLGRYRLFATDFACAVVLECPHRTVVITPADPDSFVLHMQRAFPSAARGSA